MKLRFVHHQPPRAAIFETVYEPELAMDPEFKGAILAMSEPAWLIVDNFLVGEVYGLTPAALYKATGEEVPDLDPADAATMYCYSMTILPSWQGKRLGKILFAYWLGQVYGRAYAVVDTHATSDGMAALARGFGFKKLDSHTNWFGSGRPAVFYRLKLR